MSLAKSLRCIAQVTDLGGLRSRCPHPAKYGRFCGVHCPEMKAARLAKRGPSKLEQECAAQGRQNAAKARYDDALDAVLIAAREIVERGPVPWRGRLGEALAAFDAVTMGETPKPKGAESLDAITAEAHFDSLIAIRAAKHAENRLRLDANDDSILRATDDGAECPLCECGTVEHVSGEVRCRGECGSVVDIEPSSFEGSGR